MRTVLVHIMTFWVVKCLKDCCNSGDENMNLHFFKNLRSCMETEPLSKLAVEVPCDVCYIVSCIIGHCTRMSRG